MTSRKTILLPIAKSLRFDDPIPDRSGKTKVAVGSLKRSVGERTRPVTHHAQGHRTSQSTQGVSVDSRSIKPSIAARQASSSTDPSTILQEDGRQFEIRCEAVLKEHGWQTFLTPVSGDFGADLIARKGTHSVAIQCKRYTGKVDNSAVQEAFSGRAHYDTTHAAVVSISGFTQAAKRQAQSSGVLLIEFRELPNLLKYL